MGLSWGEVERDSKPHPQIISFHGGGLHGYLVEIRSCKQTSIVPMGLPTDGNFFSRSFLGWVWNRKDFYPENSFFLSAVSQMKQMRAWANTDANTHLWVSFQKGPQACLQWENPRAVPRTERDLRAQSIQDWEAFPDTTWPGLDALAVALWFFSNGSLSQSPAVRALWPCTQPIWVWSPAPHRDPLSIKPRVIPEHRPRVSSEEHRLKSINIFHW